VRSLILSAYGAENFLVYELCNLSAFSTICNVLEIVNRYYMKLKCQ
jgi:hypothetical protein